MAGSHPDRSRGARSKWFLARLLVDLGLALALTSGISVAAPALQKTGGRAAYDAANGARIDAFTLAAEGRFDEAIGGIDAVLDAFEVGPVWLSLLRLVSAEYRRHLRHWDAAFDDLQQIESVLGSSTRDRRYLCSVYGIRGSIYLDLGLLDLASRWFDTEFEAVESLRLDDPDKDLRIERANALFRAASFALATEDVERLLELTGEALSDEDLYAELPRERARLEMSLGMGLSEAERVEPERPKRSAEVLREVLASDALSSEDQLLVELTLAELSLRAGDESEAETHLLEARARVGEQSTSSAKLDLETFQARLELERGADRETRLAARKRLEAVYHEFLREWSEVELRSGGYGFLEYASTQAALSELIRLNIELEGEVAGPERALTETMRAQAISSLARQLRAGPLQTGPLQTGPLQTGPLQTGEVTTAELRSELLRDDPAAGILIYLPAPERSHLFALDRGDVIHLTLRGRHGLEQRSREHARRIARPAETPADEQARELAAGALANALFPPAIHSKLETWERITFVGLELIGAVVPESLPFEGELLGTLKAIDSLPSLPVGLALARRAITPRDAEAWLLAAPVPSAAVQARWPHLTALDPRRDWVDLFGAHPELQRRTWIGASATAEVIDFPSSSDAALLQFFGHAVIDLERERPIALALSPNAGEDGLFFAEQAEQIAAPACVVLTACKTGRGPVRRGDAGAATLAGALLSAGAQVVVAPEFDLEIEAAHHLSKTLHRRLRAGDSVAEAMRAARAELAADSRFGDPFYTSLLRVFGLGHRALFPSPPPTTPWTVILGAGSLIALALLVPLAFWNRRRAVERASS